LAKNSSISFDSNADVYGAVIAKNIEMDSNACIHYDEALNSTGGGSGSASYAVLSWIEK